MLLRKFFPGALICPLSRCTAVYRVSKKTWTFFEIGIIPLFFKESFQNFVWVKQNNIPLL